MPNSQHGQLIRAYKHPAQNTEHPLDSVCGKERKQSIIVVLGVDTDLVIGRISDVCRLPWLRARDHAQAVAQESKDTGKVVDARNEAHVVRATRLKEALICIWTYRDGDVVPFVIYLEMLEAFESTVVALSIGLAVREQEDPRLI